KAIRLQLSQPLDERAVILLGRIEVGMAERRPIAISRRGARGAGLLTPLINTRALRRQIGLARSLIPGRPEVVRRNQDEMRATGTGEGLQPHHCLARQRAGAPQRITAEPGEGPFEFVEKARSRWLHL